MQGILMADTVICVSGLASQDVMQILQQDDLAKRTLLIDCRPFMAFNEAHFHMAHNIHLPTIVKRRSKGHVALEYVVQDADTRARLLQGFYRHVILYDANMNVFTVQEMEPMSELYLALRSLCEAGIDAKIAFVQGGYPALEAYLPQMCSPRAMDGVSQISGEEDFWAVEQSLYPIHEQGPDSPHLVMPWLYIGNAVDASRIEQLQMLGITAILNVSEGSSPPQSPVFMYKQIPVEDNASSDLSQWFPDAIQFIESVRDAGGKVLVHCYAGISRSATVCLAYLMQTQRLTLDQAFSLLKSHRSKVNPNLNFMTQLAEFERTLGLSKNRDRRVPPLDLCNTEPLSVEDLVWSPSLQEVPSTPTSKQEENIFTFEDVPNM